MQVNQCGDASVMIGLHDHVDVTVKSGGHEVCGVAQLVKSLRVEAINVIRNG